MDLRRGLGGPDGSGAPSRPVDPRRQIGLSGGFGSLRFGDGEAESGEGSVAVGFGAVELLSEREVEMEAGASEGGERLTVAPIEGEESARFSGGGAGDRGFLDEGDGGASLG